MQGLSANISNLEWGRLKLQELSIIESEGGRSGRKLLDRAKKIWYQKSDVCEIFNPLIHL